MKNNIWQDSCIKIVIQVFGMPLLIFYSSAQFFAINSKTNGPRKCLFGIWLFFENHALSLWNNTRIFLPEVKIKWMGYWTCLVVQYA